MGISVAPEPVGSCGQDDGNQVEIPSHVSLRAVDDLDASGVVDVSGFREENASGVRRQLRLVDQLEELPDSVSVEGLAEDEDLNTVMETVRRELGAVWDVFLEISGKFGIKLFVDSVGGHRVKIRRAGEPGMVLRWENKHKQSR